MRVRGRRRCRACGSEWSYFETGEPACPDCGSLRSVGVDEDRTLHTDAPVTLDLEAARSALADRPLQEVAEQAERAARDYVNRRGFVDAGALQALDDSYLAAAELRTVAGELRRRSAPADDAEAHFLALLRGAEDGDRPEEVPRSLHTARGLATATVVGDYRRDVLTWVEDGPVDGDQAPPVRPLLDRLRAHERRIEAIDGAVSPGTADRLVAAARALGEYLRTGETDARDRAQEHLGRLDMAVE